MRFPLQTSAKPLALLAGALVLAASISGTALAHEATTEGFRQNGSNDARIHQGQRAQKDFRAQVHVRHDQDRQDKKRSKHAKHAKRKHRDQGNIHAGHQRGSRHGRRHAHGFAAARFDCRPVREVGTFNGRPARIGGTGCYNAFGQFYVVPRSRYLIHYLY